MSQGHLNTRKDSLILILPKSDGVIYNCAYSTNTLTHLEHGSCSATTLPPYIIPIILSRNNMFHHLRTYTIQSLAHFPSVLYGCLFFQHNPEISSGLETDLEHLYILQPSNTTVSSYNVPDSIGISRFSIALHIVL